MIPYLLLLSCLFPIAFSSFRNASVTYDKQTGNFVVHDYVVPNAVAVANFQNEILLTGWSYLEVTTNDQYPDSIQAYAAGVVEGHVTGDVLSKHWYNILSDYCEGEEQYCNRLAKFLQKNLDFMNKNIKSWRAYNVYWHQIALTLEQLKGLEDGFKNSTHEPSTEVDVMGLLLINLMGDLEELEIILNRNQKRAFGSGSCSALVKILPNFKDIYFSHDTWLSYNTMLRILKKYDLKLHVSMDKDSPIVPGHTSTFSSQPGMIFSGDDFYLISSGLAVMETTIGNHNASLWQYIKAEGTILEWQRNIVANRLAKNGDQWTNLVAIMNSGTYNNQWMILDFKKFKPGHPLQDGLFWVLEQIPGYLHREDKTDVLRKKSYWSSYNIPYFEDIFNLSGGPDNVKKYGDWFSHERTPRALIFKRDHSKVTDIDSMIKLMRYNDFIKDPLSRCNCTPPHNADAAISSRCDLNPANGTYPFDSLTHRPYGATDMKLTSYELFQRLEFVAICGPTYDSLPPFQWSKSDFNKTKHEGHPDLWMFKPIVHKWLNNGI